MRVSMYHAVARTIVDHNHAESSATLLCLCQRHFHTIGTNNNDMSTQQQISELVVKLYVE
jgi:hypothetical protein